jgi:hypothetical protein
MVCLCGVCVVPHHPVFPSVTLRAPPPPTAQQTPSPVPSRTAVPPAVRVASLQSSPSEPLLRTPLATVDAAESPQPRFVQPGAALANLKADLQTESQRRLALEQRVRHIQRRAYS